MELLHSRKLLYGISCCYTSANYDSITSEEYYDMLIRMGAYFVWYFHYMPVGNDASPELLPTPEQRQTVYNRIRDYRTRKPLFAMDFQNDAEFVGGCIAGGRRYMHINANGDVDPCVFIHYSDSNIREKTLLETMRSPLFQAYHDGQPFNENMMQPCPMLENPAKLRAMVEKTGAKSTDMQSPETADHLPSATAMPPAGHQKPRRSGRQEKKKKPVSRRESSEQTIFTDEIRYEELTPWQKAFLLPNPSPADILISSAIRSLTAYSMRCCGRTRNPMSPVKSPARPIRSTSLARSHPQHMLTMNRSQEW